MSLSHWFLKVVHSLREDRLSISDRFILYIYMYIYIRECIMMLSTSTCIEKWRGGSPGQLRRSWEETSLSSSSLFSFENTHTYTQIPLSLSLSLSRSPLSVNRMLKSTLAPTPPPPPPLASSLLDRGGCTISISSPSGQRGGENERERKREEKSFTRNVTRFTICQILHSRMCITFLLLIFIEIDI